MGYACEWCRYPYKLFKGHCTTREYDDDVWDFLDDDDRWFSDDSPKKICTCPNGKGAEGTSCPTDNAQKCQWCNHGYYLTSSNSCASNSCNCKCIGGGEDCGYDASGASCPTNGAYACEWCRYPYKLFK